MNARYAARQVLMCTPSLSLATASIEAKPEVARVQFAVDKKFALFFKTFRTYRKFPNLIENPFISVEITPAITNQTVQMDGEVELLIQKEEDQARRKLIRRYGESDYFCDPQVSYFRFVPRYGKILTDGRYPPTFKEFQVK